MVAVFLVKVEQATATVDEVTVTTAEQIMFNAL